jgi:hypothetical protein
MDWEGFKTIHSCSAHIFPFTAAQTLCQGVLHISENFALVPVLKENEGFGYRPNLLLPFRNI